MSMAPRGGGGGWAFGGGGGGGDDTYNIFVNFDLSGARVAFQQLNQMFVSNTQIINNSLTQINQTFNNTTNVIGNIGNQINSTNSQMTQSFGAATTAARALEGALGSIATRYEALAGLSAITRGLGDAAQQMNAEMERRGGGRAQWESGLREIAAMATGLPGGNMQETVQSQLRMIRGGMTPEEARSFAQQVGGFAAITRAGPNPQVDERTYIQTQENLSRVMVALGGDIKEMGKLGGMLMQRQGPAMDPVGTTLEFANLMRGIGFGPGATGQMAGQAARWLTEAVPSLEPEGAGLGMFGNMRDAMAFFTAISQGVGPERAATTASAAAQGMLGLTKGTKDFATWQQRELGVTDQMDMLERTRRVVGGLRMRAGLSEADFEKGIRDIIGGQEGTDQGRNLMKILGDLGLKNVQSRRGVAALVSQSGTLQRILDMPEVTPEQMAGLVRRFETSQTGIAQRARGMEAAGGLEGGERYRNITSMLEAARGALLATPGSTLRPEQMGENVLRQMARFRGFTGDFTEEQRALFIEAARMSARNYRTDFGQSIREAHARKEYMDVEQPAEGQPVSNEIILQMARSGLLNEVIDTAIRQYSAEQSGEVRPGQRVAPRQPPDVREFDLRDPGYMFGAGPRPARGARRRGDPAPGARPPVPEVAPYRPDVGGDWWDMINNLGRLPGMSWLMGDRDPRFEQVGLGRGGRTGMELFRQQHPGGIPGRPAAPTPAPAPAPGGAPAAGGTESLTLGGALPVWAGQAFEWYTRPRTAGMNRQQVQEFHERERQQGLDPESFFTYKLPRAFGLPAIPRRFPAPGHTTLGMAEPPAGGEPTGPFGAAAGGPLVVEAARTIPVRVEAVAPGVELAVAGGGPAWQTTGLPGGGEPERRMRLVSLAREGPDGAGEGPQDAAGGADGAGGGGAVEPAPPAAAGPFGDLAAGPPAADEDTTRPGDRWTPAEMGIKGEPRWQGAPGGAEPEAARPGLTGAVMGTIDEAIGMVGAAGSWLLRQLPGGGAAEPRAPLSPDSAPGDFAAPPVRSKRDIMDELAAGSGAPGTAAKGMDAEDTREVIALLRRTAAACERMAAGTRTSLPDPEPRRRPVMG